MWHSLAVAARPLAVIGALLLVAGPLLAGPDPPLVRGPADGYHVSGRHVLLASGLPAVGLNLLVIAAGLSAGDWAPTDGERWLLLGGGGLLFLTVSVPVVSLLVATTLPGRQAWSIPLRGPLLGDAIVYALPAGGEPGYPLRPTLFGRGPLTPLAVAGVVLAAGGLVRWTWRLGTDRN